MRATFSPGIVRSCSPAASSVVNISENAVESQAASCRPDTFRKPSTATDRRAGACTSASRASDGGGTARHAPEERPERGHHHRQQRHAHRDARAIGARNRGDAGAASSLTTSPARGKRSAGRRSRQRRMVDSHDGSRSGTSSPRRPGRLGQAAHRRRQRRGRRERTPPRDHLVHHEAEGVDVGRRRQIATLHLFGRHVVRRPENLAGHRRPGVGTARAILRTHGQAEVGDDNARWPRPAEAPASRCCS